MQHPTGFRDRPSLRGTFANDFKQFFLRGLVVLLPSVLTIWIVVQAYRFVDKNVAQPINSGVRLAVIEAVPYFVPIEDQPEWFQVSEQAVANEIELREQQGLPPLKVELVRTQIRQRALESWWEKHPSLNFIGLGVAILLFYLAGRILGSYLGRRLTDRIERLLARVPIFKQVYPYVKQVVDFVLGERQIDFKAVAAVEYPRKGIWSLGFITGRPLRSVSRHTGEDMVTIFIPSSPTPFTGYTIMVRRSDVIELDVGVEQALRFTVSGGVLNPEAPRRGVVPSAVDGAGAHGGVGVATGVGLSAEEASIETVRRGNGHPSPVEPPEGPEHGASESATVPPLPQGSRPTEPSGLAPECEDQGSSGTDSADRPTVVESKRTP